MKKPMKVQRPHVSPRRVSAITAKKACVDDSSVAVRDIDQSMEDIDEKSGVWGNWQRRQFESVLRRCGLAA